MEHCHCSTQKTLDRNTEPGTLNVVGDAQSDGELCLQSESYPQNTEHRMTEREIKRERERERQIERQREGAYILVRGC